VLLAAATCAAAPPPAWPVSCAPAAAAHAPPTAPAIPCTRSVLAGVPPRPCCVRPRLRCPAGPAALMLRRAAAAAAASHASVGRRALRRTTGDAGTACACNDGQKSTGEQAAPCVPQQRAMHHPPRPHTHTHTHTPAVTCCCPDDMMMLLLGGAGKMPQRPQYQGLDASTPGTWLRRSSSCQGGSAARRQMAAYTSG
jgi:hypothetical protein